MSIKEDIARLGDSLVDAINALGDATTAYNSLSAIPNAPLMDSVEAVVGLAEMKKVHWLVILNQHWRPDLYETLCLCKEEYDRVQRDLHATRDPHGANNG